MINDSIVVDPRHPQIWWVLPVGDVDPDLVNNSSRRPGVFGS